MEQDKGWVGVTGRKGSLRLWAVVTSAEAQHKCKKTYCPLGKSNRKPFISAIWLVRVWDKWFKNSRTRAEAYSSLQLKQLWKTWYRQPDSPLTCITLYRGSQMAISFRGLSDDRGGGENGGFIFRLSEKMFTKVTVGFVPGGLESWSLCLRVRIGPGLHSLWLGCSRGDDPSYWEPSLLTFTLWRIFERAEE